MDDYVQTTKQMIELWIFYTSKLYYIITMKQIGIIIVCSTNLYQHPLTDPNVGTYSIHGAYAYDKQVGIS